MSDTSSISSEEYSCLTKRLLDFDDMSEDDMLNPYGMTRKLVTLVPVICATTMIDIKRPHGGSVPGRRVIHRDRIPRHRIIIHDYFKGEKSRYTADHFRRRFRMDINLFLRILYDIRQYDDYFTRKVNAAKNGRSKSFKKMVAAVKMLAYGCAADNLDEYVRIGESTAIECLKRFCDAIIGIYEEKYLRKPTETDIAMLLKEGENRGFPGMIGSLDCMHWHWANFPTAWHGTHTNGFKRVPTLILEAVASQSLWIWHAFFGMSGSNNDINVLDRSPLFDDIINGVSPACRFTIRGNQYNMGYYLSDGIYPNYATLIQTISNPNNEREHLYTKRQEAVRKDMEHAFGVMQSRWHIVKGPARMWKEKDLGKIMKTCIILHNMIIEDEQLRGIDPELWEPLPDDKVPSVNLEHDYPFLVSRMLYRMKRVRSTTAHNMLKTDLINHLCDKYEDE
ncbi:protein ALP1-like [Papaver somniferum]|uniref:protein ALP1-like n=1 Tax=Papaver somniferum TaxID=3469 RepID=UPI000E701CAF|nr:protein ALP1-like [Papaver somniferum]